MLFAGDTTASLMWRLQNGEGPAKLKPKALVLMIGANNLLNASPKVSCYLSSGTVTIAGYKRFRLLILCGALLLC